jgi:hypothetical protein
VVLAALPIFVLAGLGVLYCALQAMRFVGMALNPRRPVNQRRIRGLLAGAFAIGMFASAAIGYLGIVALMYYGVAQDS